MPTYENAGRTYNDAFLLYEADRLYYIGAPVGGSVNALSLYCIDDTNHLGRLFSKRIDVGADEDDPVVFYGGSNDIRSIVTTRIGGGCVCDESTPPPYSEGVQVEFFDAPDGLGVKIGEIYYHHLANRVADGTYNQYEKTVGTAPAGELCCYEGAHSHFESEASWPSWVCWQVVGEGDDSFRYP